MKKRELINMGVPAGDPVRVAIETVKALAQSDMDNRDLRQLMADVVADPEAFKDDPRFTDLLDALAGHSAAQASFVARAEPAPWRQWGDDLDENSVAQMRHACDLPVAVAGALMPDAHLGYGLPIGGVLATENAVVPYAVGVDIACRMKMTILDLPLSMLDGNAGALKSAIDRETRFGIGVSFKDRRVHDVLDEDWSVSHVTLQNKDKAWAQLGTSGSGNHFVEFGAFTTQDPELGVPLGEPFLALLSHSGSRGTGASVCSYYSRRAMELHSELPKELRNLAWLELDSEDGDEYWNAMELMGKYAAANHEMIHYHIAKNLGAEVLLDVENHHNFAWKEEHDGKELVVHRKGATPAGDGVLGVIPGSMATSTYLVRGKGNAASLCSAAHGAGRVMSRTQAKKSLTWKDAKEFLAKRNVTLMSAGLDEVPMVYKDIDQVMKAQTDLVDIIGHFQPRLVKMAPAGERPED